MRLLVPSLKILPDLRDGAREIVCLRVSLAGEYFYRRTGDVKARIPMLRLDIPICNGTISLRVPRGAGSAFDYDQRRDIAARSRAQEADGRSDGMLVRLDGRMENPLGARPLYVRREHIVSQSWHQRTEHNRLCGVARMHRHAQLRRAGGDAVSLLAMDAAQRCRNDVTAQNGKDGHRSRRGGTKVSFRSLVCRAYGVAPDLICSLERPSRL